MKVIKPIALTDATLTSSTVTEDDYPEWDVATTYAADDYVISVATHRVYRSVQNSNTGNDPTTDDGTWWTDYGATNRWKPFDGTISAVATDVGSMEWVIEPAQIINAVAIFGLSASQVSVSIDQPVTYNGQPVTYGGQPVILTTTQTRELVDDSEIIDWYTFFTTDLSDLLPDALFHGFTIFPGDTLTITVGGGGAETPSVGEIVFGRMQTLGTSVAGSSIGLESYSTSTTDTFGNRVITQRAYATPIEFSFVIPRSDTARLRRTLTTLRDIPAVYFVGEDLEELGAMTYGLFQDFDIPLVSAGVSNVILEVEGLI